MTKFKAALTHLFISVIVIVILFSIVYYIWYPQPFFSFSGVLEPMRLLVLVDAVIGPLLTFIVYKQGKRLLKLDLSIIVTFQLAAMIYGSFTIYNGRPSIIVFNNGQFQYLIESFAKNDDLIFKELKPSLFSKPKMAYIKNYNTMDIYNGYAYFEPISDYEAMLKAHSFSITNMKAKFKSKITEIGKIAQLYKNEEIVFFKLQYKASIHYVAYSIVQNKIIAYLKF